jgi:hypothetical protein
VGSGGRSLTGKHVGIFSTVREDERRILDNILLIVGSREKKGGVEVKGTFFPSV